MSFECLLFSQIRVHCSDIQESVLYGPEGWHMPAALDERVETPTHRSCHTHQRTGADERKRAVPPAHFMAFMAGAAAFFAFVFTIFIAFMAAAFFAFAMARREVSEDTGTTQSTGRSSPQARLPEIQAQKRSHRSHKIICTSAS